MPNIFTLTAPSIGYKKSVSINIVEEEKKYIVYFNRIDHSYTGQFGYDWMREEWLDKSKGICIDGLEELKQLYTPIEMDVTDSNGKAYGDYYVPWLTMFPNHKEKIGKEVELILTLSMDHVGNDIDYETERFALEPTNPNLRVEPNSFSIMEALNPVMIKIYCDKPLEKDEAIEVKSSTKNLVGKLNVLKNSNHKDYTINIPVVFSYLIDKNLPFGKNVIENELKKVDGLQAIEDYLNKQSLNQALIQVKLDIENTYDWGFSKNALKIANVGKNPRNGKGWQDEEYNYARFKNLIVDETAMKVDSGKMLNFFHHQFGLKETLLMKKKNIILYLTSLSSDTAGGSSFAAPLDNKHCIIFKNNLNHLSSYAHEIAHTLGLLHTFPETKYDKTKQAAFVKRFVDKQKNAEGYLNRNLKSNQSHPAIQFKKKEVERYKKLAEAYRTIFARDKYKFKKKSTENIMDYDLNNHTSFTKFQWKIMQEEANKYYH